MWRKIFLLLFVGLIAFTGFVGCSDDDDDDNDNDEPAEVFFEEDRDNTFLASAVADVNIEGVTFSNGSTTLSDGDTLSERILNLAGSLPDLGLMRAQDIEETQTINLTADGGTCMDSGPWNADQEFTIDFQQRVSVSYHTYGVSCLGSWGYTVTIEDAAGNAVWSRQMAQGIGMDVDQEDGSLLLDPGNYNFHVDTYTGTRTYASLTYTPGTSGNIGSSIVVYHNGELYEVADAGSGVYYDYTIGLTRGNNTIRVLVIGNFDSEAEQDLLNLFAASEPINIYCMTDELTIRAVLSWSIDNSDVDLHLVGPGGTVWSLMDCYYGNSNPDWGVEGDGNDETMLDFDNTSGFGPETIVLPVAHDGLYNVVVHYYSDHGGGNAPSRVELTLNEETTRTYGPRTLIDDEMWIVAGINVDDGIASFAAASDSTTLFTMPTYLYREMKK